jgi:hypothetical protein
LGQSFRKLLLELSPAFTAVILLELHEMLSSGPVVASRRLLRLRGGADKSLAL